MSNNYRNRPSELSGKYSKLHGEYKASFTSGLLTAVAAHTSTLGHLFVMRVPTGETKKAIIRYVNCQFGTTTAMGTQQAMGLSLAVHRGATAVYTGGTAIDMFTVTNSQKLRANDATTMFAVNNVRIATTDGMTVPATQVIDAHPLVTKQFLSPVLGEVADVTLLDARDDGASYCRSALALAAEEVLVIKNQFLMGATGVGRLTVNIEWEEVTL
jgi:hypothetical protein